MAFVAEVLAQLVVGLVVDARVLAALADREPVVRVAALGLDAPDLPCLCGIDARHEHGRFVGR